jgi:hypothetical protein
MKLTLAMLCGLMFFLTNFSIAHSDQQIILGVLKKELDVFSEDAVKEKYQLTEADVQGSPILAINPRNLVKVNVNGKDVWLRSSQLELSTPKLASDTSSRPPCPASAVGAPADVTSPAASGIGPPPCRK